MPYPAYQGAQFYFDITIGHHWHHDFSATDVDTGGRAQWEGEWSALCVIRDNEGNRVATLDHTGTADGLITFSTGLLELDLDAAFTSGIAPTTQYGRATSKAFLWADVTLTDPIDGEPYILARGKGNAYLPTTIGA